MYRVKKQTNTRTSKTRYVIERRYFLLFWFRVGGSFHKWEYDSEQQAINNCNWLNEDESWK